MSKRRDLDLKSNLSSTQEVLYQRGFKRADKAAGYAENKRRK